MLGAIRRAAAAAPPVSPVITAHLWIATHQPAAGAVIATIAATVAGTSTHVVIAKALHAPRREVARLHTWHMLLLLLSAWCLTLALCGVSMPCKLQDDGSRYGWSEGDYSVME